MGKLGKKTSFNDFSFFFSFLFLFQKKKRQQQSITASSLTLRRNDEERFKVLDRAWELGATFWDTSCAYGDNEDLIGKWFTLHPERRRDIFLCTKFGLAWKDVDNKIEFFLDTTPEACRAACGKSLQRLGVETIDLFYIHRFDKKTPVEKTMEALVELKR